MPPLKLKFKYISKDIVNVEVAKDPSFKHTIQKEVNPSIIEYVSSGWFYIKLQTIHFPAKISIIAYFPK